MMTHISRDRRTIVFTRYPQPGRTKTRLIPALGDRGAAWLQRRMTERTIETVRQWIASDERASAEVRFVGAAGWQMRQWLGRNLSYCDQGDGDLGDRLVRAFAAAFAGGAQQVTAVGIDCPGLSASLLQQAFSALAEADVVLGPANDGGYYLVALRQPEPALFAGIDWGTERVFQQTIDLARSLDRSVALLPALDDIDRAVDLPVWDRATGDFQKRISIVIPTLNEAKTLPETLTRVLQGRNVEAVVADGGSQDDTVSIAKSFGATTVESTPGRASQMNAGANVATGEILLFLHADTQLPVGFDVLVRQALSESQIVAGAFELQIGASLPGLPTVERVANWRSRVLQFPYGDQGIFLTRACFCHLGGFPELPIMEDFELVRQLQRRGKLSIVPVPVTTSGRRWQNVWRTTLLNQVIVLAYLLNVPPDRLVRWYRQQ